MAPHSHLVAKLLINGKFIEVPVAGTVHNFLRDIHDWSGFVLYDKGDVRRFYPLTSIMEIEFVDKREDAQVNGGGGK